MNNKYINFIPMYDESLSSLVVLYEKGNFVVYYKKTPENVYNFTKEGVVAYLKYLYITNTSPFIFRSLNGITPDETWHMYYVGFDKDVFPPLVGKCLYTTNNMPERQAGQITIFDEIVSSAMQILKEISYRD